MSGDITIEVIDLHLLDQEVLKKLRRATFGSIGWMLPSLNNILRGYAVCCKDGITDLSYNRGDALIARNQDGEIMGWALVRHPSRVVKARTLSIKKKYAYAGRRADFMVYIKAPFRGQKIARQLLLVAFNNFGKVIVFPHDVNSEKFFSKNSKFCLKRNSRRMSNAQYRAFEIF